MKNITYDDFKAALPDVVSSVLYDGEMVRIAAGDAGAFIVMQEPEYYILMDALRTVIEVAGSVEEDEKTISVETLLKKLGG